MSYQEGKCIFCAGTGKVIAFDGGLPVSEPCTMCGGTGIVIEHIAEPEDAHADDPEPVRPV